MVKSSLTLKTHQRRNPPKLLMVSKDVDKMAKKANHKCQVIRCSVAAGGGEGGTSVWGGVQLSGWQRLGRGWHFSGGRGGLTLVLDGSLGGARKSKALC